MTRLFCYPRMMKTRLFTYFSILLLFVAFIDVFVWRYEPKSIEAGQSFIYWSHVEQIPRAWLFLPFLAFLGIWLSGRKLYLAWISKTAMLYLSAAATLFFLVAPIASITTIARHLQSASNYHLYYQYEGIGDVDCDVILVRCDATGLACEFVGSWQVVPLCLGHQTPIRLEADIQVFIHSELVYEE